MCVCDLGQSQFRVCSIAFVQHYFIQSLYDFFERNEQEKVFTFQSMAKCQKRFLQATLAPQPPWRFVPIPVPNPIASWHFEWYLWMANALEDQWDEVVVVVMMMMNRLDYE